MILGGLSVLAFLFYALDFHQYLTLDYLKSERSGIETYYQRHPVITLSLYFLVYILMAALSLPGGTAMTVLAGTLFGFWMGTLLVSFASSLGATLAMLIARSVFRDYVQTRFKEQI